MTDPKVYRSNSPLARPCPRCEAPIGERCRNLRYITVRSVAYHRERRPFTAAADEL